MLLKATSLLGIAVGGTGTVAEIILLSAAIFQGSFFPADPSGLIFIAVPLASVLVPFLSALGLLFLPLKNEHRDILGFVALIGSMVALIPAYFFVFFLYCNATHSTCS